MGNVWEKFLNWIFQIEVTIEFKFNVQKSCRDKLPLYCDWNQNLNLSNYLLETSKIIPIVIKNVWEVTLSSSFEGEVIVALKYFLWKKDSACQALQECLLNY